jgi:hypothetical protein
METTRAQASSPGGTDSKGRWRRLTRNERLTMLVLAFSILVIFGVARSLTPDPRGFGTHQQLGLQPCFMVKTVGVPCPFCGMTTSFSHMAAGDIQAATRVQPAGMIGFVTIGFAALSCIVGAMTGRWPIYKLGPRQSIGLLVLGVTVLGASWLYKIVALTF